LVGELGKNRPFWEIILIYHSGNVLQILKTIIFIPTRKKLQVFNSIQENLFFGKKLNGIKNYILIITLGTRLVGIGTGITLVGLGFYQGREKRELGRNEFFKIYNFFPFQIF